MNAQELLTQLTEKQVDRLFSAARSLPAERLDWVPDDGSRSALDQLQEVATIMDIFRDVVTSRKLEWSAERFAQWREDRKRFTDLDELEAMCRRATAELVETIRGLRDADLDQPVDLPFSGPSNLADVLAYHYWNMAYHEGQINYIVSLEDSSR